MNSIPFFSGRNMNWIRIAFLIPLVTSASLLRHNEQGLSPTHAYSVAGPEEAVSNLNGNLSIRSQAAAFSAIPLGVRVERSFNSHWRDPMIVHQFDLNYDKADQTETNDDGVKNWKIEFKDNDGVPNAAGLDVVGRFVRRMPYIVREAGDIPTTWMWAAVVTTELMGASHSVGRFFNQPNPEVAPKSTTIDEGLQWMGVGLQVAAIGLQLYNISTSEKMPWGDHYSLEYTAAQAVGLTVQTGYLLTSLNVVDKAGYFAKSLPFLSLALSIYSLATLDPEMPAYEVNVIASVANVGMSLYSVGTLLAGGSLMPGVGVAMAAISIGAMIISEIEADKVRWETAQYSPQPWQFGVNGYQAMYGNKFQEDLSRPSRMFGGYAYEYKGYDPISGETGVHGLSPRSGGPMAEMNLVRADGGASRHILADHDPIQRGDTIWYSYLPLSNDEKTRVYYCDAAPFEHNRYLPQGTKHAVTNDPNDFYIVKEPDGTWARFGAGNTKGSVQENNSRGGTYEVYWALPNSIHSSVQVSGRNDSVSIVRDPQSLEITKVMHSGDPRWVEITRAGDQENVITWANGTEIDRVTYRMQDHTYNDGYNFQKQLLRMMPVQGGREGPTEIPIYASIPDGHVRMVQSISRPVSPGKDLVTSYEWKNGNLATVQRPSGATVDYNFDPAGHSWSDGFCHSRTERAGNGTTRTWNYSYRGWSSKNGNGENIDGGTFLTTSVTKTLISMDSAGTTKPVESSTSELYRFHASMDGRNIRHNPEDRTIHYQTGPADTNEIRLMDYKSSRLQLVTQILGSQDKGMRTDYVFDGDHMIKKMDRLGRDTALVPVISLYEYDPHGNLSVERTNPSGEMEEMRKSMLVAFSERTRNALLDGTLKEADIDWNSLKADYQQATGDVFDSAVRLEALDRAVVHSYLNEDHHEFWVDSAYPARNPQKIKDSLHWLTEPGNVRAKVAAAITRAQRDSAACSADSQCISISYYTSVIATRKREAVEKIAAMAKDSAIGVRRWKLMPDSVVLRKFRRNPDFNPWGRYLAGIPLGQFTVRKHPDTASTGSGVYGSLVSYDSAYVRPMGELMFINGWWVPSKRWWYGDRNNPFVATSEKTFLGWDGSDTTNFRYQFDSTVLDPVYHAYPIESKVWKTRFSGAIEARPSTNPDFVTKRSFDPRGRKIQEISPSNDTTSWTYDLVDRVTGVRLPDGARRGTFYQDQIDAHGRLRTIDTTETGRRIVAEFDGLGRLLEERQESSDGTLTSSSRYSYGIFDKLVWMRDADGRATERTYDYAGRLLSVRVDKPGLGQFERHYLWNDIDRVLTEVDGLGRSTTFRYNVYGQDVEVRRKIDDTSTYVARYAYDNEGHPVVVVAPNGDTTRHVYDWKGAILESRYPDDLVVRNHTDWLGSITSTTTQRRSDPSQKDSTVVYNDGLGRKDSLEVVGNPRMGQRFFWDTDPVTGVSDAGQLMRLRLGTGVQTSYGYNRRGTQISRLTSAIQPWGTMVDTFYYGVRADQSRERIQLGAGQAKIEYAYDGLGRLSKQSFTDPTGAKSKIVDTVIYTRAGLMDSVRYGNGLTQKYSYEPTRPLMTSLVTRSSKGQVLAQTGLTYDDEGNVLSMDRPNGEKANFEYDGLYRLATVRYPSGDVTGRGNLVYRYDRNGNRLGFNHEFGSANWTYKAGTNLLETGTSNDGFRRYSWDYRGNLSRETRWSKNPGAAQDGWLEDRNLSWNTRNELERLSVMRRADQMDTSLYGYGFDESGWRTSKASGTRGTTDTTWRINERTVWDGVNAMADSGLTDTGWAYHVHLGLKRVAEIRKENNGWKPTYVVTDHLGTVQALVDDTGSVRGRYQLDPYGNLEGFQGDRTTAYLYTGKPRDAETGWDYFGGRYYDPVRGMWLGRDQKEQYYGPFQYSSNNPMGRFDPNGNWDKPSDVFMQRSDEAAANGQLFYAQYNAVMSAPAQVFVDAPSNVLNQYFGDGKKATVWDWVGTVGTVLTSVSAARQLQVLRSGSAVTEGVASLATKAIIPEGKFGYLFGQASGRAHNIERAAQNAAQFARVGIRNNVEGRSILQAHFDEVVSNSSNITKSFTNEHGSFVVRESLLAAPGGFLKIESTWKVLSDGANQLSTAIPKGGL